MSNIDKRNNDPVWLRIKSLRSGIRGEQTELMAYCGLAQNTYNGWDKGTLKSYTKYIDKIASFYKVSADWILTGVGIMPPETGYPFGILKKEKSPTPEGVELSEAKAEFIQKIMLMDDDIIDALNKIADQILAQRKK